MNADATRLAAVTLNGDLLFAHEVEPPAAAPGKTQGETGSTTPFQGVSFFVNDDGVRLREGPGTTFKILATLKREAWYKGPFVAGFRLF